MTTYKLYFGNMFTFSSEMPLRFLKVCVPTHFHMIYVIITLTIIHFMEGTNKTILCNPDFSEGSFKTTKKQTNMSLAEARSH